MKLKPISKAIPQNFFQAAMQIFCIHTLTH